MLLSNYSTWLPEWLQQTASSPTTIHVPQEACIITTPLLPSEWRSLLAEYPQPELVQFFTSGLSNGFRIGFTHPKSCLKRARKNMESAYLHREVVDNYLQMEVCEGRVAGPFTHSVVLNGQISRFGMIPKHHKPNSWCLIIDLSHPMVAVSMTVHHPLCAQSSILLLMMPLTKSFHWEGEQ